MLLACGLFLIQLVSFSAELNLKHYLKKGEKDATLAVLRMLDDAAVKKNVKIVIEEGTYHFFPEKAFEKYCYVSNHDNGMRRIAFPIIGFDELTIEGHNAKFIFHGVMMPFNVEESKNVCISGITIDWHIPLHSEALVVANNVNENSFDLRISEDYPYVVRNNNLVFIKEGYEHDLGRAILFDPQLKRIAYNTNRYTPIPMTGEIPIRNKDKFDFQNYIDFKSPDYVYQATERKISAEEIKPGVVRIKGSKNVPPVGMVLVCKGQNGNNRIANAFHLSKSNNVVLKDINIYHAGGMGIIGERSQHILLENINIESAPGSKRMVSTTADATHFVNCKGSVTINKCSFKHQLDDATNVHGAYVIVDDIIGPDQLGVRVGHYQQAGFTFAEKGDKVGFVNQQESALPQKNGVVKSVEQINERYYIITFEQKIPEEVNTDYVLENLDWYPELTITNSVFADNRARGILLSTPKKIIVENNYFSNMMSAIFVPVELSWWYESGHAQDVLIRNNKFGDCCYGGGNRPVIFIHTSLDKNDYIFGSIRIEENEFNHFDSAILRANGVKELEFVNNKIQNSGTYKPLFPDNPVVDVEHIGNLKIDSIQYDGEILDKIRLVDIEGKSVVLE